MSAVVVARETFPSLSGEVRLARALGDASILRGKSALERRELARQLILSAGLRDRPCGMREDPEESWASRFQREFGVPL